MDNLVENILLNYSITGTYFIEIVSIEITTETDKTKKHENDNAIKLSSNRNVQDCSVSLRH
jgi:hypothetical protein